MARSPRIRGMAYVSFFAAVLCSGSASAHSVLEPGEMTIGKDIRVKGFLDTYYQFNFNKPPISETPATVPQNNFRAFDRAHNQFQVNAAYIGLSHDANPVGFDFTLGMGPMLDALSLSGPSDTTVDRSTSFIRNAHLKWSKDWFGLELGRIDADFGLERIDAPLNFNYSRSLQFALMQPKFLTGVNAIIGGRKNFFGELGIFNGTDRFSDNNKAKTGALKFGYANEMTNVGVSWVFGPELDANSRDWRQSVNVHAKHMFATNTGVGFEGTYVNGEGETINAAGQTAGAGRYGVGVLGSVGLIANASEALRFEYMHDDRGAATLRSPNIDLFALTATHRHMITKNFSLWGEVRWDRADGGYFSNSDGVVRENDQTTLTAAATFMF